MPTLMKKPKQAHDWSPFRADERLVERFSPHGTYRLALAYANSYHVAMSSLAFQRVHDEDHIQHAQKILAATANA